MSRLIEFKLGGLRQHLDGLPGGEPDRQALAENTLITAKTRSLRQSASASLMKSIALP